MLAQLYNFMQEGFAYDIHDLVLQQNLTAQTIQALQAKLNISGQAIKTLQVEQQLQWNSSTQEIRGLHQQQQQDIQECKTDVLHLQETLNKTINAFNFEFSLLRENISQELANPASPSEMCGGPGWRRVAFINMTDPNQDCPQGLKLTGYSIRSCGRADNSSRVCSSVTFPINSSQSQYSQVCGRATAYRWGYNYAFYGYHSAGQTINGYYVDGLSVTHGYGCARTHIWTFASGLFNGTNINDDRAIHRCPGDPGNTYRSPSFVGNDYFCEGIASSNTRHAQTTFFLTQSIVDWPRVWAE